MKKAVLVLMVLGVVSLMFSSCSSTKSCPAYGNAEQAQTVEVNS